MKKTEKIFLAAFSVMAILSLTMIIDFSLSGEEKVEIITSLKSEVGFRDRSGSSSVSYSVHTASHHFQIDVYDHAKSKEGDTIKINASPIYGQVNTYKVVGKMDAPNMTLGRILIGLVLPLLTIALSIAFYFHRDTPQLTWAGLFFGALTLVLFFI